MEVAVHVPQIESRSLKTDESRGLLETVTPLQASAKRQGVLRWVVAGWELLYIYENN